MNITFESQQLPAYLQMVRIHCMVCKQQIVKANGQSVCSHTELHHNFSPGEKAYVCRKCWNNYKQREKVDAISWKEAALVVVNPDVNG